MTPRALVEPVRAVQETGRQALVEMSRLVGLLREETTSSASSRSRASMTLDGLVAQVRESGLRGRAAHRRNASLLRRSASSSPPTAIVQEALTNALKHSGGASALVTAPLRAIAISRSR